MSDRPTRSDDRPLFQDMDEKERVLAPQQVPGALPSDATSGDAGAESDVPVAGVIPAVPAGAVTGGGAGPSPSSTAGGGVLPVAPVRDGTDEDATRDS